MTQREKTLALARKLYALQLHGVGGEAANARQMLARLMEREGIALDNLVDAKKEQRAFSFTTKRHKALIMQVVSSVVGRGQMFHYKGERGKVYAKLTAMEHAEVSLKVDHYWLLWKQEVAMFYEAFVHANKLGAKLSEEERTEAEPKERTPEELERMRQLMAKMNAVRTDSPNKRIQ